MNSRVDYSLLCIAVLIAASLFNVSFAQSQTKDDLSSVTQIYSYAAEHKLIEKPIGEVVVQIGKQFIGQPYAAHTLDDTGAEHLVVNLQEFDCVTLIENSLALARCVKESRLSFDAFRRELEHIRYRGGNLAGYPSRLHYFTEWIRDNVAKSVLKDVTKELGGQEVRKELNFMTTHRDSYDQLRQDSLFSAMQEVEEQISARSYYYIPKQKVHSIESKLQDGDIIAITTSVGGLDVSHTGIAVKGADGRIHLLHAPNVHETVTITKETLVQYLREHKKDTGIIVARAAEVK
jgi:hypothetical protein